jgi:hypothetical protein
MCGATALSAKEYSRFAAPRNLRTDDVRAYVKRIGSVSMPFAFFHLVRGCYPLARRGPFRRAVRAGAGELGVACAIRPTSAPGGVLHAQGPSAAGSGDATEARPVTAIHVATAPGASIRSTG